MRGGGLCRGIVLVEEDDTYGEIEWSRPADAEHPCDATNMAAGTAIPPSVKTSS
jgi:hypothetical protein